MSDITPEKVRAMLDAATPGPWFLTTGCSWRRILQTGTDKPVIVPTRHHIDGHPDLLGGEGNYALAVATPDIATAYLAAVEERDRLAKLVAELERVQDLLIAGRECASCGHWVTGAHVEDPDHG